FMSDSEDGDEPQNDTTCLMAIDLDIIDLQKENKELLRFNKDFTKTFEKLLNEKHSLESENSKLLSKSNDLEFKVKKLENNKEVVEPCKKCDVLTKEVDSLKYNISRLHDEALNFSKFKKSSIVLDDMLNHQKLSQDKEGLVFSKFDKILPCVDVRSSLGRLDQNLTESTIVRGLVAKVLSYSNSSLALFELPSTKSVLKSTNVFTLLKALSNNLLDRIKRFVLQVFGLLSFHILQTTLLAPLLAVFEPIHD
ncbi:hypothetical protein Tco_0827127, partial [Tanacetum coccineum]